MGSFFVGIILSTIMMIGVPLMLLHHVCATARRTQEARRIYELSLLTPEQRKYYHDNLNK